VKRIQNLKMTIHSEDKRSQRRLIKELKRSKLRKLIMDLFLMMICFLGLTWLMRSLLTMMRIKSKKF
jgi:hypothetical protein